jgi:hypothetical protein
MLSGHRFLYEIEMVIVPMGTPWGVLSDTLQYLHRARVGGGTDTLRIGAQGLHCRLSTPPSNRMRLLRRMTQFIEICQRGRFAHVRVCIPPCCDAFEFTSTFPITATTNPRTLTNATTTTTTFDVRYTTKNLCLEHDVHIAAAMAARLSTSPSLRRAVRLVNIYDDYGDATQELFSRMPPSVTGVQPPPWTERGIHRRARRSFPGGGGVCEGCGQDNRGNPNRRRSTYRDITIAEVFDADGNALLDVMLHADCGHTLSVGSASVSRAHSLTAVRRKRKLLYIGYGLAIRGFVAAT